VHLGIKPDAGKAYSENREAEIWDAFSRLIDVCESEQIDLLLIAGDLFHRQPLLRELKEVNFLFSKLTHTKIVFVAGNHDYVKPASYYLSFAWNDNVYPLLGSDMQAVEFPELAACVYGFSYYSKEIPESRYDDAAAQNKQKYEILLAHGGDDKHIPFQKNKLRTLGYNYIALGHIHKPQEIEPHHICYAGSLEPTDKNDIGPHGYILGTVENGETRTQFVTAAKREYLHLEIPVEEELTGHGLKCRIQETIQNYGKRNIYKIILQGFRDPEIMFDLEGMDVIGNILEIIDETRPAYDFDKLAGQNADNLLGKFIYRLKDYDEESVESQALYEGVQAILKAKRG